jgi:uncharacterized protein YyaL (SSP411 family)
MLPRAESTERPVRSIVEIRRTGNRLKNEKSLYLRQHAHNPLDWYPWGPEALERANEEDKPIFLSIGYASCHWCHVMEKEVFEDDEVAALMNEHFICIKVDREERPDLDHVYMQAVQMLTGGGGWPMSVFLTPDQQPFFGGTYFPKDQFLILAGRIQQVYRQDRDSVDRQADLLRRNIAGGIKLDGEDSVDPESIEATARAASEQFDSEWGGVASHMKFPAPLRWMFLLDCYRKTGEQSYAGMVKKTLDHMGSGGIHDHIGGGFHRYTTERTWLVPHFEKMLYDNALLASLYLQSYSVFSEKRYAEIARDTLDFLIREMSGMEGGFYSSCDADSGGEEGSFYLWTPEEIIEVAGPTDGPLLARWLGVIPQGNFEGRSILTRRTSVPGAEELFYRHRPSLRARRATRLRPLLDRKIITAWNGLAIAAFAQGYAVLGEDRYRAAAEKAAKFILKNHLAEGGWLLRASNHGVGTASEGILDDYAFLAGGLLELYRATGNVRWLRRALGLLDYVRINFTHPQGGFYLTSHGLPAPVGRQVDVFDDACPSGNSAMLQALITANALTSKQAYREEAEKMLRAYAEIMKKARLEMAWWHDAAMKFQGPFYDVVISGDPDSADTRALVGTVRNSLLPNAVLSTTPPAGPAPELEALLPSARNKTARSGKATAYVCRLGSCKQPTSDPSVLKSQILEGWSF